MDENIENIATKVQTVAQMLGKPCAAHGWNSFHAYQDDRIVLSYKCMTGKPEGIAEVRADDQTVFFQFLTAQKPDVLKPGEWERRLNDLYAKTKQQKDPPKTPVDCEHF